MERKFSELRRDGHHGGWVLISFQPEREQLLNLSRAAWPISDTPNLLSQPEKAGAKVIWKRSHTLPNGEEDAVKVIANRFPLYGVDGQEERMGMGMYDQMRGIGAHEIIIESGKSHESVLTMHPRHYALTLQAYQERLLDLRNDERLHAFSIFREWWTHHASPRHPHSQLIASAIFPIGHANELNAARDYYNYKERCLFCDMIRQERDDQIRLVFENDGYIAYCPFASRYPFELHLFPRRHGSDFTEEPQEYLEMLAEAIYNAAYRLEQAVPGWSLLMLLHTRPVFSSRRRIIRTINADYHWHFEFLPQPPGMIDWYCRTGTHVDPTAPEKAAAHLREITVPSPWKNVSTP